MTDLEKMIGLLMQKSDELCDGCRCRPLSEACIAIANHLIANGVTFANRLEEKQATCNCKTSDWIPVTERLPEPYVEVLTLRSVLDGKRFYQKVDYVTPDYGGQMEWLTDLNSWKSKVTHWMPLPEPPKGE